MANKDDDILLSKNAELIEAPIFFQQELIDPIPVLQLFPSLEEDGFEITEVVARFL
jgi:hypothetical protein